MPPLSCSCSLAREDVSCSNSGGAKASQCFTIRHQTIQLNASTGASLYCCAYLFSTTPGGLRLCVGRPHIQGQLAPITLPRVALLLPLSYSSFLARKDVLCPCSGGAKAPRCFTLKHLSSMLQRLPTHPSQLEPTTLPQCRLVPVSRSAGLSLPLSISLSPALSLSLSFSLALLPLCPTLSLSLSLSHKGVFGMFGGSLSPPRGSNPPPQDRRGVVYPLSYEELLSALLFRPFLLPPSCRPLSCVSPFARGCAQQRVEEPHSVSGYRVRLPEERSLE